MVFIVVSIIFFTLFIFAIKNANKIAEWLNIEVNKIEEEKKKNEEKRLKRTKSFEQTQKNLQSLFSHKRISDAVDDLINEVSENEKYSINAENSKIEEKSNTSNRSVKENLRGPILGGIYYDPHEDNLVSPQWRGEHSIWEDEEEWHDNPYEYERNRYRGLKF